MLPLFIQAAAQPATASDSVLASVLQMLPLIALFGFFYFMVIRPQSKRAKEHRHMIDTMQPGNEVIFAGGLMGKIRKLEGEYAVIALNANQEVIVQRAAVISVLPVGTIDSLKV